MRPYGNVPEYPCCTFVLFQFHFEFPGNISPDQDVFTRNYTKNRFKTSYNFVLLFLSTNIFLVTIVKPYLNDWHNFFDFTRPWLYNTLSVQEMVSSISSALNRVEEKLSTISYGYATEDSLRVTHEPVSSDKDLSSTDRERIIQMNQKTLGNPGAFQSTKLLPAVTQL